MAPLDNMHLKLLGMFFVALLISFSGVTPCRASVPDSQDKDEIVNDYNHVIVDCNMPSESLTAYIFNDINDALDYALIKGSEDLMTIYLMPGDFTLKSINCNNVLLRGLSGNADEIVIRSEGGRAEFLGSNISVENVTIDDCLYGDRMLYRNCKVTTQPRRIVTDAPGRRLYDNCRFECYDDALNGNAVYVNCTFDLYGAAPIYESAGSGTVFLGSLFNTYFSDVLYLTGKGRVTLVDCDFKGDCATVFWTNNPRAYDRYYQEGVTLRGTDYTVSQDSLITIDMSGLRLSEAYSFTYKGVKHYNIYNLLQGSDGWDPLKQEKTLSAVKSYYGRSFTDLLTELVIEPQSASIESKDAIISFQAKGIPVIGWNVTDERLRLIHGKDNNMISLAVDSDVDELFTVAMLEVFTDYGLQASSELRIQVKGEEKPSKTTVKKRRLFGKNKRVDK